QSHDRRVLDRDPHQDSHGPTDEYESSASVRHTWSMRPMRAGPTWYHGNSWGRQDTVRPFSSGRSRRRGIVIDSFAGCDARAERSFAGPPSPLQDDSHQPADLLLLRLERRLRVGRKTHVDRRDERSVAQAFETIAPEAFLVDETRARPSALGRRP